jgi:hypothetical protein
MSALAPKADMCSALAYVCFGPIADMCTAHGELLVQAALSEICASHVVAGGNIPRLRRMSGAVDCYLRMLERVVRKMIATPV